jgi:hypothetical protein
MATGTGRFNTFLFFKLPSAWWCGVRLRSLDSEQAVVTVRHSWFNQNPFKSMFWAVQGMAAELSTGAMVMKQIRESGRNVSMLVASNRASFSKKAVGKITFRCGDGALIRQALKKTIQSGEGQTINMRSTGTNEEGLQVSAFEFEWTIKLRS